MARPLVRVPLAVLVAALPALTWWRPDRAPVLLGDGPPVPLPVDGRTGWEVLGPVAAVALALLGAGAAAAALAGRAGRPSERRPLAERRERALLGASGAAAVSAAVCAGLGWGVSLADGPWFAAAAGVIALVVALRPSPRVRRVVAGPAVASPAGSPGSAGTPDAPPGRAATGRTSRAPSGVLPAALAALLTAAVEAGPGRTAAAGTTRAPSAVLAAALAALLTAAAVVAHTAAATGPAAMPAAAPWVRVAALDDARPLRSGEPALPVALPADPPAAGAALAAPGGVPAVVRAADGIVAADRSGRAVLVARAPEGSRLLGVAGGRVARLAGTIVVVTGLEPGDPTAVIVEGVAAASAVGDDGTVWVRGAGEPTGTVRRLDLAAYRDAQRLDTAYLPVVGVRPSSTVPVDVTALRPVPGGALRRTAGGAPELLVPVGPDLVAEPLRAPTCVAAGVVAGVVGGVVAAGDGGFWWAGGGRLAHVDGEGRARGGPALPPGTVLALRPDGAGGLLLAVGDAGTAALWHLPGAADRLVDGPCSPGAGNG